MGTAVAATVVGASTELFGVGGGLVVVPALVLVLVPWLPVQRAVGTSLLVVAARLALEPLRVDHAPAASAALDDVTSTRSPAARRRGRRS